MWNQSKKSYSEQLREERELLFGQNDTSEHPIIPILSTVIEEEVSMPDIPENVPEQKIQADSDTPNTHIDEPFVSYGEQILYDFTINHVPLKDLVRKYYHVASFAARLSTDDYKSYIITRIGHDKYDEVVRARQRDNGSKIGKSGLGGQSRKVQSVVSALQPAEDKTTPTPEIRSKYKAGDVYIPGVATLKPIQIEFPTGLPFSIPPFSEPAEAPINPPPPNTEAPAAPSPEQGGTGTLTGFILLQNQCEVYSFLETQFMLDFAINYPTIWEAVQEHIVQVIGHSAYSKVLINRLNAETKARIKYMYDAAEISRAQ